MENSKLVIFVEQIKQWITDERNHLQSIETKNNNVYAIHDVIIHVGYGYGNVN